MSKIRDMTDSELREGIERCEYRLKTGEMGIMTHEQVNEALLQYKGELRKRGQTKLEYGE